MPRIREVKPEFFLDEHLAEVSHAARLLFVGLWTLADREGRLEDRPARIKAQLFPYGSEDVDALLNELAAHRHGFIRRYEVDGRAFIEVRSFTKHQRPHPKETPSRIPAPPDPAVNGNGKPGKETASRESPTCQVDPSGGSMGTWAHGSMGHGRMGGGETGNGDEPPALSPSPEQRAENATTETIRSLQLKLGGLLARLSEHPNSRQMVPAWCRTCTEYTKADGTRVRGVADFRTVMSIDRLEKSIADAEWHLAELDKGVKRGA